MKATRSTDLEMQACLHDKNYMNHPYLYSQQITANSSIYPAQKRKTVVHREPSYTPGFLQFTETPHKSQGLLQAHRNLTELKSKKAGIRIKHLLLNTSQKSLRQQLSVSEWGGSPNPEKGVWWNRSASQVKLPSIPDNRQMASKVTDYSAAEEQSTQATGHKRSLDPTSRTQELENGLGALDERQGYFSRTRSTDAYTKSQMKKSVASDQQKARLSLRPRLQKYVECEKPILTEEFTNPEHCPEAQDPQPPRQHYEFDIRNKAQLKDWFRLTQMHQLPDVMPLDKFQQQMMKVFNKKNLSFEAQSLYDEIVQDKMHFGDPIPLIDKMFEQFERPEIRGPPQNLTGYTHDFLIFTEKIKALGQELDLAVAARLAKLLVEQFDVRQQKLTQLMNMPDSGEHSMARQLERELSHKDAQIYVDDIYLKGVEGFERVTRIAQETTVLLASLGVPASCMFSDPKLHPEELRPDKEDKFESRFPQDNWQTVVVAGIPFYLDHQKEKALPFVPEPSNKQEFSGAPAAKLPAIQLGNSLKNLLKTAQPKAQPLEKSPARPKKEKQKKIITVMKDLSTEQVRSILNHPDFGRKLNYQQTALKLKLATLS